MMCSFAASLTRYIHAMRLPPAYRRRLLLAASVAREPHNDGSASFLAGTPILATGQHDILAPTIDVLASESIGGAVVEVMDLPDAAVALPSLDPADIHAVCHAWAVEAVARRPGEGGAGALIGDFRVEAGAVYTPAP